MKKTPLLNSNISSVISRMGHTETLAIGDCGLPIPSETERIDLALVKGIPTFIETLKSVLLELEIEEVILASEIKEFNNELLEEIKSIIGNVKITFISHEEFKENLKNCKAVIRTGEQKSYANIILKSGVIF
ncbi:MAG TPA: D-ribose pyranase [Clostridium sp.]|nr:D-ribose pyranase [Clostridium sp.]